MTNDVLSVALAFVWPDGPSSGVWDTLEPQLLRLREAYEQSDDEDLCAELAMQISDLLRQEAPELYRRFLQARKALREEAELLKSGGRGGPVLGGERGGQFDISKSVDVAGGDIIKTGDISGSNVAIGAGAQATTINQYAEPRYVRYADIECPRRVLVAKRFTLTVGLTMQPQADSVVQQRVDVYAGKVKVRLAAPGFEVDAPGESTLQIDPDEDSAPIVFYLKPRAVGRHAITVEFWQRGNCIASAPVPVEVCKTEPLYEAALIGAVALNPWLAGVRSPDLTLIVTRDPTERIAYTLVSDGVVMFQAEHQLPRAPDAFIAQLYDEVHLLQRGADSAGNAQTGPCLLAADQVERRLAALGYRLWDDLFPAEFKRFYERERARWRVVEARDQRRSLFVESNEAAIPWELVRPYSGGRDAWEEDYWCSTFFFARWLVPSPELPDCLAALPQHRLGALAAIVPTCYPELRAATDEHALLHDLIARHHLADRSPPRATEAALIALLEQGGYDWMHIVTHGDFFAASALHSSAIGLEDRQWLASSAISGPRIRNSLYTQRPAFVLNACHVGRAAPSISGATNWATQLIGAGAGLVLAPRWSVADTLAAQFSREFYAALLDVERPATLAEAVWRARQAIRQAQPDDPTWLAYSLFAHPNATIAPVP